jgi:hypothetical protein
MLWHRDLQAPQFQELLQCKGESDEEHTIRLMHKDILFSACPGIRKAYRPQAFAAAAAAAQRARTAKLAGDCVSTCCSCNMRARGRLPGHHS